MANDIRSIYSRRQRMAPGQYSTPLADFLDKLPDYISGYQQQKLQEKKYDDALARQTRLDERQIELDKRNEERYQEGIIRDENRLKRNTADELLKNEQYDQAISIYNSLGDNIAATAASEARAKTEGMNDSFVDLRNKLPSIPKNSSDIYAYMDEIKDFENKYDTKVGGKIDNQLFQIKNTVSSRIKRMNEGMIPISEWQNMGPQGRIDYTALIGTEKKIKDLSERASKATIEKDKNEALKSLELAKKTYQEILSNPRYKLETEEQYRQSIIDKAKLQSDAAIKEKRNQEFLAKKLEADRLGLTMPNITEGSSFEGVGAPTPEEMVAFEENISKQLDGMTSDIDNEDNTVKPFNIPGLNTLQADPVKPQSTTQTTDKIGQNISTKISPPKGPYGSPEKAFSITADKILEIKKLEDRSRYSNTKGGDQTYKNALKKSKNIREKLEKDILSIYDPNTRQFRYPGYVEMFSPQGDVVRGKQLDTRNVAGGILGRRRIPVAGVMSFIEELFPSQIASM
tara:strand:- start:2377 stop:3918 length:1542 start_codon:yes stop_codon:yes gene_type:complete